MNSNSQNKKFFPSRKLGQNFLHDTNILKKIVSLGNLQKDTDEVLEIGPGLGSLTVHLAQNSRTVFAIEKDERLLEHLKKNLANIENVLLIHEDALDMNFSGLSDNRLKLIANLPYNISTPLLFKIHSERDLFSSIIVMLQKEVGERICSEPDKKSYGVLSVLFQNYFDTKLNFTVKPSAFSPKPKVDSVVISLTPLEKPRFQTEDHDFFRKFVKSAFSTRRKMIGNSLSASFDKEFIKKALENAGIDLKRRAENLSVEELARTSNEFYRLSK